MAERGSPWGRSGAPLWLALLLLLALAGAWRPLSTPCCAGIGRTRSGWCDPMQVGWRLSASYTRLCVHEDLALSPNMGAGTGDTKTVALHVLDCLTSPRDEDDPEFDLDKDLFRDQLLAATNFADLKLELKSKGLKAHGDKEEMLLRLLLHYVDPSIDLDDRPTIQLEYVNSTDISSERFKIQSEEQIAQMLAQRPDADDMQFMQREGQAPVQRQALDGLDRRVLSFPSVSLTSAQAKRRPSEVLCYSVAGKPSVRASMKRAAAIVLLPSPALAWTSPTLRAIADEIAFHTQSVVLLPGLPDSDFASQFDDVLTCLATAKRHLDAQTFALIGVADSGSLALDIAARLHSLACMSLLGMAEESAGDSPTGPKSEPSSHAISLVKKHNLYRRRAPRILDLRDTAAAARGIDGLPSDLGNKTVEDLQLSDEERAQFDSNLRQLLRELEQEEAHELSPNATVVMATGLEQLEVAAALSPVDEALPEDHTAELLQGDWARIQRLGGQARTALGAPSRSKRRRATQTVVEQEELLALQPRAVAVVGAERLQTACPEGLVGALLVLSTQQAAEATGDLRALQRALEQRREDIVDYSFRVYEGVTDFLRPRTAAEHKCRQDALELTAMWVDAMASDDADLVDGAGAMKGGPEAWVVVGAHELRMPVRPLGLATHLHDDEAFLGSAEILSGEGGPIT